MSGQRRAVPVAGALAGHLAGGYDVDWGALAAKLPVGKDRQSKVAREKLWRKADANGDGFVSLAELDEALHDEHGYEELFGAKPVLMRAFQSARKAVKPRGGGGGGGGGGSGSGGGASRGDEYVEKAEFRLLLVALRQVFEVYLMFNSIDTSDDRRISLEEFTSKLPELRKWGATLEDAEAESRCPAGFKQSSGSNCLPIDQIRIPVVEVSRVANQR